MYLENHRVKWYYDIVRTMIECLNETCGINQSSHQVDFFLYGILHFQHPSESTSWYISCGQLPFSNCLGVLIAIVFDGDTLFFMPERE